MASNDFVKKFFPVQSGLRDIGNCPLCAKPINEADFRDELSKKEFKISGMCQKCQDDFWGKDI